MAASTRSNSSVIQRKKKRTSRSVNVNECINWFIMCLQDNAASTPKIFIDGDRYETDEPYKSNQCQVHFAMTNEGSPRALKYRLNFLEDEGLLTLQQLLPSYSFLTELRFEFCSLTYDQILFIQMILQENQQIVHLSLSGNPKKNRSYEAAYHLLLQGTKLKVYTLQLCKLDAHDVSLLYYTLNTPDNYSKNLVCLNLGCNQLGDEGSAIIANMLRVNRTLQALNLSENGISEQKLINILEVFTQFALTDKEVHYKREMRFVSLMKNYFPNVKKEITSSTIFLSSNASIRSNSSYTAFISNHPFVTDSFFQDGQYYCTGNNSLLHLNIAYNAITGNVLEFLLETIKCQKRHLKSGGLQRVITDSQQQFPDLKNEIHRLLISPAHRTLKVRPSSVN